MRKLILAARAATISAVILVGSGTARAEFADPLEVPTAAVPNPAAAPLLALAGTGQRLIGVGMRGVIVMSEDGGRTWTQVIAPVQSDLTAVQFPTPDQGWAVGHDGVVLHSSDGGLHWEKQFDGRQAEKTFADYYRARVEGGEAALQAYLDQILLNFQEGPTLPYLDVWFENAEKGYAVGQFGMIAATSDGGKTWLPWLDHIENPDFLNLNAVRGIGGDVYIVGEKGTVYRLDRDRQMFIRSSTGYAGSFFGIVGSGDTLVAYGLRGSVYRSANDGKSWSSVPGVPPDAVTGGTWAGRADVLLVNNAGRVLLSSDGGSTFKPIPQAFETLLTDVRTTDDHVAVVTGLGGVRLMTVP